MMICSSFRWRLPGGHVDVLVRPRSGWAWKSATHPTHLGEHWMPDTALFATMSWRLPAATPSRGRLLFLTLCNGATVEFVQPNDSCPTAHQRRYRQPRLCFIFRVNDGPSAVDASFASPIKIPKIALRVEQLDQIKAFLACVGRLDQVAIHVSLLLRKIDTAFVAHPVNTPRPPGDRCQRASVAAEGVMSEHPGLNLPSGGISSASCNNFQVLCLNYGQLVSRPIMFSPQCFQFFTELSRGSLIQ